MSLVLLSGPTAGRPTASTALLTEVAQAVKLSDRQIADFVVTPLHVLLVLAVAIVVRLIVGRFIRRVVRATADGKISERLSQLGERATAILESGPLAAQRRAQRAGTVGSVLRSIANVVIFTIAGVTVLGEVGINLAPIIAGAGIIGVALGFGAQNVVRDYLSGFFLIVEDWYGVGDVIDAGPASGTVEAISLRITRLRDVEGVVWHIRNGEIPWAGNKSKNFSRTVLDIAVAYDTDVGVAKELIAATARELWLDPDYDSIILAEPQVWGVESFADSALAIRLVVKTVPLKQWDVARALRERIKAAFDQHGVEFPYPQRTVWLRTVDELPTPPRAAKMEP